MRGLIDKLKSRSIFREGLPLAVVFLALALSLRVILTTGHFWDEDDLIAPIQDYMDSGKVREELKYPSFPYIFLGGLYKIYECLGGKSGLTLFVRGVNVLVYGLNIFVFHRLALTLFNWSWSVLATFLFALCPVVFYSSVLVKTESLLLLECQICIFFCNKIWNDRGRLRWHVGAGIVSALAMTTKYNPSLLCSYLITLHFISGENSIKGGKFTLKGLFQLLDRKAWTYLAIWGAALGATFFLTWPTIWKLGSTYHSIIASDDYFLSTPSVSKAVNEWNAFPYGRYSFTFIFILTAAFGNFNYYLALLGIFLRVLPRKFIVVWGSSSLVHILISTHMTLLRVPYMFTIAAPFFIVCTVFCLERILSKLKELKPGRVSVIAQMGVILLSIMFSLLNYKSVTIIPQRIVQTFFAEIPSILKDTKPQESLILFSSKVTHTYRIPADSIDYSIRVKNPPFRYIVGLSSYFNNFCLYRGHQQYRRQCEFFKSLMAGGEGYEIMWRKTFELPFPLVHFEMDEAPTIYVFKLKD